MTIRSDFKTARKAITVLAAPVVVTAGLVGLSGCASDATVASSNLSAMADQFQIDRRIVFYNGITDSYMLTIEGKCSIEVQSEKRKLDVTCKTGPDKYIKDFLGLADNVTYFVEQLQDANVSAYNYRVIFKPQSIVPDFQFEGNAADLKKAVTPRVLQSLQP